VPLAPPDNNPALSQPEINGIIGGSVGGVVVVGLVVAAYLFCYRRVSPPPSKSASIPPKMAWQQSATGEGASVSSFNPVVAATATSPNKETPMLVAEDSGSVVKEWGTKA